MNLQFIEPQKRYFAALKSYIPELVCFIDSSDINQNVEKIIETMPSTLTDHNFSLELFDFIVTWLGTDQAALQ